MQFMEPLGKTDGSVAVAWDGEANRWRGDVLRVTRELAPTLMRWGGCFSSYYRWKEAVGPRKERIPMQNLLWGGMEGNQVGTVEFVDFCRQVGAAPLNHGGPQLRNSRYYARCVFSGGESPLAGPALAVSAGVCLSGGVGCGVEPRTLNLEPRTTKPGYGHPEATPKPPWSHLVANR